MEKIELFKKYKINIDENILNNFKIYFNQLIEWNNKFNLTAITEENDVYIKHFLDSVYPEKHIEKNARILDIGAGAGFPSLPLKIVRPDLDVTMIDSLNKRITFLDFMIKTLGLKSAQAEHSRAEDYAQKHREKFDAVVARAVSNLSTLSEYALPLVKLGGKFIAYKGENIEEELSAAQNAIGVLGGKISEVIKYCIEGNGRSLVIIEKVKPTPAKYPRGKNLPKTNPL